MRGHSRTARGNIRGSTVLVSVKDPSKDRGGYLLFSTGFRPPTRAALRLTKKRYFQNVLSAELNKQLHGDAVYIARPKGTQAQDLQQIG